MPDTPDRAADSPYLAAIPAGIAAIALVALVGFGLNGSPSAAESARVVPPPAIDAAALRAGTEVAVIAGGCFWGVQAVFQHVDSVHRAVSGYAGGAQETAHYEMVGSGRTGHAEAVEISYDPARISYGRILQIYFSVAHDPTQRDRQGPDVGPQYRSTIFPTDAEQARIAAAYVAQLDQAHVFEAAIATTIEASRRFYPAEPYHQDFLARNPHHRYIVVHDMPKLENLKRLFPTAYRDKPALVADATAAN